MFNGFDCVPKCFIAAHRLPIDSAGRVIDGLLYTKSIIRKGVITSCGREAVNGDVPSYDGIVLVT
jgi:hypothetical protein